VPTPRHARGKAAEQAVEDYLHAAGYVILARNARFGALEIDLVARRGALAVIVEVRTRGPGSFQGALESVTPTKRRRILLAAERAWRFHLARMPGIERMRIDVAGVTFADGKTLVEYIEGAITA
jgi:putative endonuclease